MNREAWDCTDDDAAPRLTVPRLVLSLSSAPFPPLRQECAAGHEEPQRPRDVGHRREPFGELPSGGLVAADELQRAEHEDRPDDDAGRADPARGGGGLGEGDAGEGRPGAGEEVAEMLADGDAEVAVEGLKDD